jgi:hypothetical protein
LEKLLSPHYPYYVLDYEPEYMSIENQTEEAAGKIQKLGALEFLCRPAVGEGTVSQDVMSLKLSDALRDPDTGEWQFPDPEQDAARIAWLQQRLAKRSGMPVREILKEQENRLIPGILKTPQQTPLQPAVKSGKEVRRTDAAQPEPGTAMETPSRPVSDERERQFLSFISEHPDIPVTEIYKALGIGVSTEAKIRERLIQQGLLVELELRNKKTGAGRPMKCILPTVAALEFLEKDPPAGRGGVIHRYMQQIVQHGATAKGFTAQREKVLDNGAIVDVHLEKDGQKLRLKLPLSQRQSGRLLISQTACSGAMTRYLGSLRMRLY